MEGYRMAVQRRSRRADGRHMGRGLHQLLLICLAGIPVLCGIPRVGDYSKRARIPAALVRPCGGGDESARVSCACVSGQQWCRWPRMPLKAAGKGHMLLLELRGGGRFKTPEERTRGITGEESRSGAGGSSLGPQHMGKGRKKRGKKDAGPTEEETRAAEKREGLSVPEKKEGKMAWKKYVANRHGRRVLASESDDEEGEAPPVKIDLSKLTKAGNDGAEVDGKKAGGEGDEEWDRGWDDDEKGDGLEGMRHIGPVAFEFDPEEAALESRIKEKDEKLKAQREKEESERRNSISSSWQPQNTACEAWDWFQGRSDDGNDYTTLRSREYGYVVQLYDNTQFAWFQYSRMSGTGAVHTVYSDSTSAVDPKGFYAQDLVHALTNMTEIQGKLMPFRCERDGDAIIFRHSYWLGIVHGPHITIKHAKMENVELHLTKQGFVYVGQDSYFQGAGGTGTAVPRLGRAGVVWVQGPKPARWIQRARGVELLKRQRVLCQQGDLTWLGIAKNARLEDPKEDEAVGAEEEEKVEAAPRILGRKKDYQFLRDLKPQGKQGCGTSTMFGEDDLDNLIYGNSGVSNGESEDDWMAGLGEESQDGDADEMDVPDYDD